MRLISNRFIYLFSILCKDFLILCKNCEKKKNNNNNNNKKGCRNKVFSSHSMSHYHKRRYHVYYFNN